MKCQTYLFFIFLFGNNLHEMSKSIFEKDEKTISKCSLLNILPSMLYANKN